MAASFSFATASSKHFESHETPSSFIPFEPFDLPARNQRHLTAPHAPDTVMPLALRPVRDIDATDLKLDQVIETIALLAQKEVLNRTLARHGAILFRDLPIHDAQDFSKFSYSFGYQAHEIIGIVVERPLLAPNVAPANEAPPSTTIGSHNESPQVPHAPAYIFFYGHKVAGKGGETPIGSSLELFRLLKEEVPVFVDELASKGIVSTLTYKPVKQFAGGSTLDQAFGKHIRPEDNEEQRRRKIEVQIRRYNRDSSFTSWSWAEEGSITLKHILPAIRTQPETHLPALFTALASQYSQLLRFPDSERAKAYGWPAYGDETPIPRAYLEVLLKITEETRILHKWQRGDVLVLDNRVAQHGREPWEGKQEDRRVFASLWDGELPGPFDQAAFAKLTVALPDISERDS